MNLGNIKHRFSSWAINFLIISFILIFSSCEEIIDIDIENVEQKIVIEGVLTDAPGASRVLLSSSENIFKSCGSNKIMGASITLKDNYGNSEKLIEQAPGKFIISSTKALPERTYSLSVNYKGNEYVGQSSLNNPVKIDSVGFVKKISYSIWGLEFGYYKLKIFITGKKDVDEYCIIKIKEEGNSNPSSTIFYRNKYSEGKQTILEAGGGQYQRNQKLSIEVKTIDKEAYEYFYQLNELSDNNGVDLPELFNTKSYNPKSNLSNGALGCFYVYSSKIYSVIVK